MKTFIAIMLVLFSTVAFAGDDFIFAPVISQPSNESGFKGIDSYVVSGDNGSEVFHVMSLEPVSKDSYLIVGPNGEKKVVIKY